ncbi:MAG TPA: hypothetical protein VFO75_04165 [Candidatus Dormibacteraeota bacterium]|nr:hypothetical protein [Candidatus Dormibacteraeota bacterium]
MADQDGAGPRPDVKAQIRGADVEQAMEGEQPIETSSREQAVFWRDTYREILAMEEAVMARVVELMAAQSPSARREVELSNVPVIAAQVDRFRSRLGYWEARLQRLEATTG